MAPVKFSCFDELLSNNPNVFVEAVDVLLRIARNILRDPANPKYRSVSLGSNVMQSKLLSANGACLCLFEMGFVEGTTNLVLPSTASLENMRKIHDQLLNIKKVYDGKSQSPSLSQGKLIPPVENANKIAWALLRKYPSPFLQKVIGFADDVMKYEDSGLLLKAVNIIPLVQLNVKVEKAMRKLQLASKKGEFDEGKIDYQELLLIELLTWFKQDFFQWVNSPNCPSCDQATETLTANRIEERDGEVVRIEMYRCKACNIEVPFPRYNNPSKLLETRKGRCGEWANCFTLFCRALGWDARWVLDETDHVWTEVYMVLRKEWVHCDACETIVDAPLIYEAGWKKQVSYILAYSCDEVQDVTWRYSSNHKEVRSRRTLCSEEELSTLLREIREFRCKYLTPAKCEFIVKRSLLELCNLMLERKPTENEIKGRTSGSLAWRLARGEYELIVTPYIWEINQDFLNQEKTHAVFKYSASLDKYFIGDSNSPFLSGWENGLAEAEGAQRKVESDWKMAYLSRTEDSTFGKLVWKFNIDKAIGQVEEMEISLQSKIFKSGQIRATVCANDICIPIPDDALLTTKTFAGCKSFTVTAVLSGGDGDVAWQHSQLFRQPLNSSEFPFIIRLKVISNV